MAKFVEFPGVTYSEAFRVNYVEPPNGPAMNLFDKFCALIAFLLGVVLLLLGVVGAFMGCKAHFTLPPLLGALPAFAGWGIVRSVMYVWKSTSAGYSDNNV